MGKQHFLEQVVADFGACRDNSRPAARRKRLQNMRLDRPATEAGLAAFVLDRWQGIVSGALEVSRAAVRSQCVGAAEQCGETSSVATDAFQAAAASSVAQAAAAGEGVSADSASLSWQLGRA